MNLKELKELKILCRELQKISYRNFKEFKYEICATDENVLYALKEYVKEIRNIKEEHKNENNRY